MLDENAFRIGPAAISWGRAFSLMSSRMIFDLRALSRPYLCSDKTSVLYMTVRSISKYSRLTALVISLDPILVNMTGLSIIFTLDT